MQRRCHELSPSISAEDRQLDQGRAIDECAIDRRFSPTPRLVWTICVNWKQDKNTNWTTFLAREILDEQEPREVMSI